MAKAPILGSSKTVELDDAVFGVAFNGPLVHEVVIAELAARRQGTHSTRTRGMVSGGGAKPWRQKGTGRARAGTSRSPLWKGGGTVFGPSPRHYTLKVNRKARRAALRSALSVHAERGSISVLDAAGFDAPSTKTAAGLLEGKLGGAVLVVITQRTSSAGTPSADARGQAGNHEEQLAGKSFRNLERVSVIGADDAGVADIVGAAQLVLSEAALTEITSRAKAKVRAGADSGESA